MHAEEKGRRFSRMRWIRQANSLGTMSAWHWELEAGLGSSSARCVTDLGSTNKYTWPYRVCSNQHIVKAYISEQYLYAVEGNDLIIILYQTKQLMTLFCMVCSSSELHCSSTETNKVNRGTSGASN